MGTFTDNLNLYKPDNGETGWGDEVDANFDILDGLVASNALSVVQYVRPTGDNANDGLSWLTAKEDILGAYDELPAGGGTIYFESGSYVDAVNTDRGLWLAGALDSGYGSLGTGWRQAKPILIEGVCAQNSSITKIPAALLLGGDGSDPDSPLFWFTGCNGGIALRNIQQQSGCAVPMVLGKDSITGDGTNNARFVFDNIALSANQVGSGTGPVIDCVAAYWVYMRDSVLAAYEGASNEDDERACFLIRGNAIGHGLIWIRDTDFAGGGGLIQRATTGGSTIRMDNVVQEGPTLGGAVSAPIFWLPTILDSNSNGAVTISNCEVADAPEGSDEAIKVAANNPSGIVHHDGMGYSGPCTVIGGGPIPHTSTNDSPTANRAVGIARGRVFGQHDAARRAFTPAAVRFTNRAAQDVLTWGGLSGSATVTTGKTAPDGTTEAAELSGASTSKRITDYNFTPAVGDWIICGIWMRPVDGAWPTMPSFGFPSGSFTMDTSVAGDSNVFMQQNFRPDAEEWRWIWRAAKMKAVGGGATELLFDIRCDTGAKVEYYAPVSYVVPASLGWSDAEILEFAENMISTPDTASAGQISMLRGESLHIPKGYIEGIEIADATAPAANRGRIYFRDTGGKTELVVRFNTGAIQQIAIEP